MPSFSRTRLGRWPGWPVIQPPFTELVEVNRSHPLANGLVGAYCGTMMSNSPAANARTQSIKDLSIAANDLLIQDGTSLLGWSPAGFGAQGIGAYTLGSGWTAQATAGQRPTGGASLFVIAYVINAGSTAGYPNVIGVTHNNTGTAPYDSFDFYRMPTATDGQAAWNVNGTQATLALPGIYATGGTVRIGFTLRPDGGANSARGFVNGALTSGPAASGSIQYGATASAVFNGKPGASANTGLTTPVGYMWGRTLSDQEMAWLNAEPYVLLRAVRRGRYVDASVVAAGAAGQARAMILA